METNLKKLLPILGVVCFSMTSLSAATYNRSNDQDNSDMMMKSAVPPAKYTGDNSPYCFISADYTYWTAREDGLLLGFGRYFGGDGSATAPAGPLFFPEFFGNSGFKVGLGAFLNHDGWDLSAEYTWFNNNHPAKTQALPLSNSGLGTLFFDSVENSEHLGITQITSQFKNQFNRVDLDLGRCYWAGHYVSIRPFIGLMGAWETQHLNVSQYLFSNRLPGVYNGTQRWWGVGPYTGLDTMFVFPGNVDSNDFGIFLNAGFALPWSSYHVSITQQSPNAGQPYQASTSGTYYTTSPVMQLALGLDWESWWNDHSWCFALSAAWENQVYFSHAYFFAPGGDFPSSSGNMILQGLTVKVLFAF